MATSQVVKSRLLLNVALLLALVALGLYAYLRPAPSTAPEINLSSIERNAVNRIRVERRGKPAVDLQKRDGVWHMLAPYRTRADPFQVDRLLDIVQAKAKQKLAQANLDRYGLDSPSVRVRLNDVAFDFGAINELTNEQYVASGQAVFLVAPFLGYGIAADAEKMFSRRLLAQDEDPVEFDFGRWQLRKNDAGSWSISGTSPKQGMELSQDVLNQWAAEWKLASALTVEPHKGERTREQITIRLKQGRALTIGVLSRQPQVRLLRVDENMRYEFGRDAGSRLLDPHTVAAK